MSWYHPSRGREGENLCRKTSVLSIGAAFVVFRECLLASEELACLCFPHLHIWRPSPPRRPRRRRRCCRRSRRRRRRRRRCCRG